MMDRPTRCKFCGSRNALVEELRVDTDRVSVLWRCRACDAEWEPGEDERPYAERRIGRADRRKATRRDRRRPPDT